MVQGAAREQFNFRTAFEELFERECNVRPFDVAVTIASACMYTFRKNFLKPSSIAMVPHGGYSRKDRHSAESLRWLKWIAHRDRIDIDHAANGRERKVDNRRVDGYCTRTNTVYEYQGCPYHGCPRCYTERWRTIPGADVTVETAYQRTLTRTRRLRDLGHNVEEMWSCQFAAEIRADPDLAAFVKELGPLPEPLDPRDALRGGRTNAVVLYRRCEPGERIDYIDVCSLYPWGVKYGEFPVGHPEILTENFEEVSERSRPYFGLIKCRVLPPRRLHHPVLPYFEAGKLLFPLCAACARETRQGFCDHRDDERALHGTWVTTELYKALETGYRMVAVEEVWHYAEREQYDRKDPSTGLFTQYIDCFLKLKIQASGWPGWVKTDEDWEAFLQECLDREGVRLDPSKMTKNPGLRSLAKLCLNSFWGKFGQRTQVADSKFVVDPAEFNKILFDESNTVHQVREMSENVVYVTFSKKDAFVEGMAYSNPVLAAFVTAICRLRLYSDLEQLGERVLYFDTGKYCPPHQTKTTTLAWIEKNA